MSQGIRYLENRAIDVETLTGLYRDARWSAYYSHPDKMKGLLPGALWHLSAWDGETLAGLIRCVGDDCSVLYIQDLLVMQAFQRRGIGRELMARALERFGHIRQVVLLTQDEERTRAFYTACGLKTAGELEIVCFTRINPER